MGIAININIDSGNISTGSFIGLVMGRLWEDVYANNDLSKADLQEQNQ